MQDSIEKTIDLNAPISRVWRALTDHREFGEWFRVRLDNPFVVGEDTTGQITYPGYEHLVWRATVRVMEPERLFAFTWDPGADNSHDDPETRVEFRLEPLPDGTRLTIVESGFSALPEGRRFDVMRENEQGWTLQTQNITAHVER